MYFKKNIAKFRFAFCCVALISCNSMRDITDPSWKEKQDAQELKQKFEESKQATITEFAQSSLYFDIKSEQAACDKAREWAKISRVSLDNCKLEGVSLNLSATHDDVSRAESFSYEASLFLLNEQVHQVDETMLQSFFQSMVISIDYSRTK